jgi:hypothetical protein
MIILIYFAPNTSGLVCAKRLRKWAEKAFASSTLVFHALWHKKFKNAKSTQIRQLRMEIDVTHFDTLTRLWHQKSSNLMRFQKTDEGTVGAPTCLLLDLSKQFVII